MGRPTAMKGNLVAAVYLCSIYLGGCIGTSTGNPAEDDRGGPIIVRRTVGSEGGTVWLGEAAATIPEGALTEEVEIEIVQVESPISIPEEYTAVGEVYGFSPKEDHIFSEPVTVRIPYEEQDGSTYVVLRLDDDSDGLWEPVPSVTFSNGIAEFDTDDLGYYIVVRIDPGADGGSGGTGSGGSAGLDAGMDANFPSLDGGGGAGGSDSPDAAPPLLDCLQREAVACTLPATGRRWNSVASDSEVEACHQQSVGCGTVSFAFDTDGCLLEVSESTLRRAFIECLTGALEYRRWTCLQNQTIEYQSECDPD